MGQTTPPQWWDIIAQILTIPATIVGLVYSITLIQKTKLENQKTRLEILGLEKKLHGKKKSPSNSSLINKPSTNPKSKSVLQKILLDVQIGENRITDVLMELLSPFKTMQQEKINSQRVVGSVIELGFLVIFLYADASLLAHNLSILFPTEIPSFLTNTVMPFMIASVGTSMALGLMIGDLTGLTNFTSWAELRERKRTFLAIMYTTFAIGVVFSTLAVLLMLDTVVIHSQFFLIATSLAKSLIIIPALITTALLFNAVQGILVILAIPLILLRFPITIFRKIIAKTIYYVSD